MIEKYVFTVFAVPSFRWAVRLTQGFVSRKQLLLTVPVPAFFTMFSNAWQQQNEKLDLTVRSRQCENPLLCFKAQEY